MCYTFVIYILLVLTTSITPLGSKKVWTIILESILEELIIFLILYWYYYVLTVINNKANPNNWYFDNLILYLLLQL